MANQKECAFCHQRIDESIHTELGGGSDNYTLKLQHWTDPDDPPQTYWAHGLCMRKKLFELPAKPGGGSN